LLSTRNILITHSKIINSRYGVESGGGQLILSEAKRQKMLLLSAARQIDIN
jgi:hypothetical protein